jgi:thiol-disulfide isomerase/thioredoxin
MDGPMVIRFIMEPGNMTLHFTILNDTARNVVIKGSDSQKEKEAWEYDNAPLLQATKGYRNKIIQLVHQKDKKHDSALERNIQVLDNKMDALYELTITEILRYVKKHPHSYFSAYLLNHYKRRIPTDTLETYFSNFDSKIINSDLGKNILDELFKLTDDWAFRQKFTDSTTYKALKKIKTIYDVSLINPEGTETSFSEFKGKVLLIDFWASWCGPCIRNVPYLKKLITSLKDKPFKVISVSIESDKNVWKKSLKKYEFPGIHLFDDKGLLSTFYKVLWVPHYIIVNPDGTVANMDAPQAINPQLKLILDNLLSENNTRITLNSKSQ